MLNAIINNVTASYYQKHFLSHSNRRRISYKKLVIHAYKEKQFAMAGK